MLDAIPMFFSIYIMTLIVIGKKKVRKVKYNTTGLVNSHSVVHLKLFFDTRRKVRDKLAY